MCSFCRQQEMLVVVAIAAILTSFLAAAVKGIRESVRERRAREAATAEATVTLPAIPGAEAKSDVTSSSTAPTPSRP